MAWHWEGCGGGVPKGLSACQPACLPPSPAPDPATACCLTHSRLAACLQFSIASNMVRNQGVGSLYKGLSAGLLRQATYTTARLGIYNNIFEAAKKYNDNKVRYNKQNAVHQAGFSTARLA